MHDVWYHTNICIDMAFGIFLGVSFGLRYTIYSVRRVFNLTCQHRHSSTLVPLTSLSSASFFERRQITIIYLLWRIGVHIASAYFLRYNSALYHLEAVLRDRFELLFLDQESWTPHSFDEPRAPSSHNENNYDRMRILRSQIN